MYLKRGILRMSDVYLKCSNSNEIWKGMKKETQYITKDIVTRETRTQVVCRQGEANCVAQQRDTEAHTHTQWVMGSLTQQRVTQPKGCSLTLIVCREESALVFVTPVVSGKRKPTAASVGLLANISSSCRHSSRPPCTRPPLTQHLSQVPFFFPCHFLSALPSVCQPSRDF